MTTSYAEARNQINKLVNDAWNIGAPAICGYVPKLFWQGRIDATIPPKDKHWARVSIFTAEAPQTSLGMGSAPQRNKRYTEYGVVIIQVHSPAMVGTAFEDGGKLAQMIRNAFRGASTPGCVWFRNARLIPLDHKEGFERFNVVTDFQYDEIQ